MGFSYPIWKSKRGGFSQEEPLDKKSVDIGNEVKSLKELKTGPGKMRN